MSALRDPRELRTRTRWDRGDAATQCDVCDAEGLVSQPALLGSDAPQLTHPSHISHNTHFTQHHTQLTHTHTSHTPLPPWCVCPLMTSSLPQQLHEPEETPADRARRSRSGHTARGRHARLACELSARSGQSDLQRRCRGFRQNQRQTRPRWGDNNCNWQGQARLTQHVLPDGAFRSKSLWPWVWAYSREFWKQAGHDPAGLGGGLAGQRRQRGNHWPCSPGATSGRRGHFPDHSCMESRTALGVRVGNDRAELGACAHGARGLILLSSGHRPFGSARLRAP